MAGRPLKVTITSTWFVVRYVGRADWIVRTEASEVERVFEVAFESATDFDETPK